MQIKIEKIIYPGKSLGRQDNKIVLTDSGIPGEVIGYIRIKDKKNYVLAKTNTVICPSARRQLPRCEHFHICSAYQYIDYEYQLKIKEEQLKEIFSSIPNIKSFSLKPRACKVIWGYRNKIHLHIIKGKNSVQCAYHTPGTKDKFTTIEKCFLASHLMNNLIQELLSRLNKGLEKCVNEITLQQSKASKKLLLCCFGNLRKKELPLLGPLMELGKLFSLAGIIYINKKRNEKSILMGKDQLSEKVDGKTFLFGSQSFFQINIPMLELLMQDLKKELPSSERLNLLDLYCGVGTFAIALSGLFSKITAVEASKANIFFLKKNISLNAISNIQTIHAKCEDWIKNANKKKPDILIIDPPRRGMENVIIEQIRKIHPAFIAYISCDPATLNRDLKKLIPDYKLRKIFAYDFFPHTPHIETLSILEKN